MHQSENIMTRDATIVGCDVGDGETTVHFKPAGGGQEPECLQIGGAKSIITAVGIYADGRVVIGRKAIDVYTSLKTLVINFKDVPSDGSGFATTMPLFVDALLTAWKG